jgi:hypothetical protein
MTRATVPTALLMLIPLLAGCGGWQPLYEDSAVGAPVVDSYTGTIDNNGQIVPAAGDADQNSLVTFTATPDPGFYVATYSINGGTPVTINTTAPTGAGGVPYSISLAITQNNYNVSFTTAAIAQSGNG